MRVFHSNVFPDVFADRFPGVRHPGNDLRRFITEEDGLGTVEIILIIVVIIGLIVIFRTRLTSLIGNIFDTIETDAGNV